MILGSLFLIKHFDNGDYGYTIIDKNDKKKSKVTLDDVAGLEYAKQEIFEFVDFLNNRDKYIEAGAKMPRGALFYGPPGTGKTLLAKAIAGECGVNFISASGSDFVEVYVGVGASRIRKLFDKARSKAPCVIFIDEIDALARKRAVNLSGGSQERDSTLNTLLVELDGFGNNKDILIFGATNRLELLDDALMRPGRFDRKIRFELPERKDREHIFFHYLENMNLDGNPEEVAEKLSKLSYGFSCADIANICNEACILSVRNKVDKIDQRLLEEAIDHVLLGPEKKTFRLSEGERETVAFHEAGHTVVSYISKNTTFPVKVSIMPRGKSALGFSQREMSENKLRTQNELLDDMCVLLGGRVAEEIFCGQITTGASDDIQKLTNLAYLYVSYYGMDHRLKTFYYNLEQNNRYSEHLRKDIDSFVQEIINSSYLKTKDILQNNKDFVIAIKEGLIENDTLNKDDLDNIYFNLKEY
jgi:AFG3 family protein